MLVLTTLINGRFNTAYFLFAYHGSKDIQKIWWEQNYASQTMRPRPLNCFIFCNVPENSLHIYCTAYRGRVDHLANSFNHAPDNTPST